MRIAKGLRRLYFIETMRTPASHALNGIAWNVKHVGTCSHSEATIAIFSKLVLKRVSAAESRVLGLFQPKFLTQPY